MATTTSRDSERSSSRAIHAVGKRKNAVARVYLKPRAGETGVIRVNNRGFEAYFFRETSRRLIMQPLEITKNVSDFDIDVTVAGGGLSGQAGAVKHGISRALLKVNADNRPPLKKAGHLTRDPREVERKKYGLSGARKRYQYSKR